MSLNLLINYNSASGPFFIWNTKLVMPLYLYKSRPTNIRVARYVRFWNYVLHNVVFWTLQNNIFYYSKKKIGFSLLCNSFIKSHFSYCPLIWKFCNQKSMKKGNKMQERLMTKNYKLSEKEFLDLTNEISSHLRCLNSLMTEIYWCLRGLSPNIMN